MSQQPARRWQQNYAPERKQQKVVVKVKNTSWLTKGEKVIYSFCFFMLLAVAFYLVSYSANIDQMNRQNQTIENEVNEMMTSNEILTYEMKELSEPTRILEIAEKNGFTVQGTNVKRISK
ncbi:MAG TPA: cell division protein FtsL [Pseudogracilibacillus sp.]|nr:cell division protein FtsL [Pseudogracilibacillus sp.]